MVKTIGNPLSWTARRVVGSAEQMAHTVDYIGGEEKVTPQTLPLSMQDIRTALRKGYADFAAVRTDVMVICLIYPAIGALLIGIAFNQNLLPILFPICAGFALLGPLAAVGLYEISRRREQYERATWVAAFDVLLARNFGAILVLGLYLAALYLVWILVAHSIWMLTLGPVPPVSVAAFLSDVFTTGAGWAMLIIGMAVGFGFALVVLATSVVSFPLLLHHNIGVLAAVETSLRVFRENPRVIVTWGAVVAGLLVLGSIPFFIGLIVVLPVLGHATWHLYRRAVKV